MITADGALHAAAMTLRLALVCAALAGRAAAQVADSRVHGSVLLDQLELAPNRKGTPIKVDETGWVGGDVNRLWLRGELEQRTDRTDGDLQAEALYGRLVSAYWDAVVGVRVDRRWGGERGTRALLAIGFEGLAPLWFRLEPTLYVSQDGNVLAQLEAEYELFLTQRLVMQPRVEVQVAAQDARRFGVRAGLSDFEIGARVRYEIRRELAPYAGVAWHRRAGDPSDVAGPASGFVSSVSLLAGVRLWY